MPVEPTSIEGLLVLRHAVHEDDRGFFHQTWVVSELEEALGRRPVFVQGNHSRSHPGSIRGFHAEPWDKLVYVASGRILAVVADVRPHSHTFGSTESFELGEGSARLALFVSARLGNAYCALGDGPADYVYAVTTEWAPARDKQAVAWNDPTLGVDWPVSTPTVSEADATAPTLRERYPDHPLFADRASEA